ncbi:MAG: hypothetical protein KatS3mg108_2781 [Isosphaeraceae bacterium]|jgi:hypothetical protein|nr:MAG: hypothetical protein KatS3mg108_2781 [Isosphaeraceae bacterium]
MPIRYRFGRFRDRGSYKSSEVMALFILSIFGWISFFLLCMAIGMAIDMILTRVFHIGITSSP